MVFETGFTFLKYNKFIFTPVLSKFLYELRIFEISCCPHEHKTGVYDYRLRLYIENVLNEIVLF